MRRVSNMGACRRSDDDGSPIHTGANGEAAKAPEHLPGNDVGGAVGVPMHDHTTAGAAQHAPSWCRRMTMAAGGAGAGGVRLICEGDAHSQAEGLLGQVAAELAVGPLAV